MPLVDLDDPEELRARWTALAAVAHATGFDRRWYADADGYHHQDETASVLRMVRLEDGRAVLFGFHTQHTQTAGAELLAGSPDWIGQPEVRHQLAGGELGFVYGAFNGTWARASYPGDPWQPAEDGFAPIGQWITSDEAAAEEMIEWVAEWADYLGGLDELRPAGVQLIRTAGASGLTAEALDAFFARFEIDPRSPMQPDLPAGVIAGADFTRNFAVPERFADEPDTAEVSVVEDVVIGTSDGRPGDDEEESFVVPPGISPFTGQPIDDTPAVGPSYEQASYQPTADEGPVHDDRLARDEGLTRDDGGDEEYGVTAKKQGWLRRRRHEDTTEPTPSTDPAAGSPGGPAPGTYLPDDVTGTGLPVRPAYDSPLPSSEPPRVGGGVHEGDDFYASLFADAPAAAGYTPAADEQDWETAEQPAWSDQEATSEYNPFAEEPPAAPDPEWVGGAWINGEWVEHPTPPDPGGSADPSRGTSPFAPGRPADSSPVESPFALGARADSSPSGSPFGPAGAADSATASPFAPTGHDNSSPDRSPFAPTPSDAGSPVAADLDDDDAPTAEIAAVLDTDSTEGEPASFTGPSPFAPVPQPEPSTTPNHQGAPDPTEHPAAPAARLGAAPPVPGYSADRLSGPSADADDADDQTAEIPAVGADSSEAIAGVSEGPAAPEETFGTAGDELTGARRPALRFNVVDDEDEVFGVPAPTGKAQVEPHPQPQPWPQPQPRPEPWPQPDPHPAPWPQPTPPHPEPTPGPDPYPAPSPVPSPEPSPEPDPTPRPEPTTHVAHAAWPEDGHPEQSPGQGSTPSAERDGYLSHAAWLAGVDPESLPAYGRRPEHTSYVEDADWPEDAESNGLAPAVDVEAGADERAGSVPVVEGGRPAGRVPDGDERNGQGAPRREAAETAAAVVARMSIPGLGLVGADGPRIALVPGSIEEAMRAEVERPRPRPQESEAMEALHAWCRARTAIVPSGFTIQVQVLDPSAPSYRFDLEPPDVDGPEFATDKLSGLLGDLWLTEAHSEVGGWLFARVDAAGRTLRIDRWYDQVPDWWDNPIEPRLDVDGLVRRLYGRGPQWQPSYLERLYTSAR